MAFNGFSQATGDFLWGLAMNNDRTWFQAHRDEFEGHLNQPFRALAQETRDLILARHPGLELDSHVSRIYRDARRLFGRGPYKDHLWFVLHGGGHHTQNAMFWFELSGTGWSYGVGIWDDAADVAEAFRRHIDDDPARFEALVTELAARGEYTLWGEPYKRPKGDRGPIVNPWYNRRHHSVGYEHAFGEALFSPELPAFLADEFDKLLPIYLFMQEVWPDVNARRAAKQAQATLGGELL